jgi:hypothetical protein
MITRQDWLEGRGTFAEERDLYDQGEITECEYEFGPHDGDHSDCQRMLDTMAGDSHYDPTEDYPEYDAQTAFYESTGRLPFPNEY